MDKKERDSDMDKLINCFNSLGITFLKSSVEVNGKIYYFINLCSLEEKNKNQLNRNNQSSIFEFDNEEKLIMHT